MRGVVANRRDARFLVVRRRFEIRFAHLHVHDSAAGRLERFRFRVRVRRFRFMAEAAFGGGDGHPAESGWFADVAKVGQRALAVVRFEALHAADAEEIVEIAARGCVLRIDAQCFAKRVFRFVDPLRVTQNQSFVVERLRRARGGGVCRSGCGNCFEPTTVG